ncbi:potential regulator of salt tolerance [Pseudozyma hubeiensis SY62]|uniref:Mediator of RNA polymerase II transcription subunit 11 n=1 Tax=Pseudozyma hubeiensis (strain SY62) TaxID=1305764 RepID=R9P1G7_PSEHS|nr:potential regulator of salt tolerance [Pseudozyma hubeiensis SY62]GAC94962.1 potential regulator of salt tolerance [Pseudozyma hubeiensis SY62]
MCKSVAQECAYRSRVGCLQQPRPRAATQLCIPRPIQLHTRSAVIVAVASRPTRILSSPAYEQLSRLSTIIDRTMTSAPSVHQQRGEDSLDVLPAELQDTIMEKKFAQIKQQRQDARNVLREAKQRTRNRQTDQQILLLMQADERLAALLAQAADSMRALLPPVAATEADAAAVATDTSAQHGAKAFEDKAQQWFSILNEVQYSLRSAVRYLRQAQLSPLTPPVGPDARSLGRAGSAGRGHNLSLLEVFSDIGGLHGGTTFKLPPLDHSASSSSGASSRSSSFSTVLPESSLSLQALRERESNWKALSGSLQQIHQSMTDASVDGTSKLSPELSLLESIRNGCSSDRILIDALVNTNHMA